MAKSNAKHRNDAYRSVLVRLVDHPDFQALPGIAKLAFFYFRFCPECGPIGLFRFYPSLHAERMGIPLEVFIDEALPPLLAGRWVLIEAGYILLRNAMRFEPGFKPATDAKHLSYLKRVLFPLRHLGLTRMLLYSNGIKWPPEWGPEEAAPVPSESAFPGPSGPLGVAPGKALTQPLEEAQTEALAKPLEGPRHPLESTDTDPETETDPEPEIRENEARHTTSETQTVVPSDARRPSRRSRSGSVELVPLSSVANGALRRSSGEADDDDLDGYLRGFVDWMAGPNCPLGLTPQQIATLCKAGLSRAQAVRGRAAFLRASCETEIHSPGALAYQCLVDQLDPDDARELRAEVSSRKRAFFEKKRGELVR